MINLWIPIMDTLDNRLQISSKEFVWFDFDIMKILLVSKKYYL